MGTFHQQQHMVCAPYAGDIGLRLAAMLFKRRQPWYNIPANAVSDLVRIPELQETKPFSCSKQLDYFLPAAAPGARRRARFGRNKYTSEPFLGSTW